MVIDLLGDPDVDRVVAASHLFDEDAQPAVTASFLRLDGHHLLFASIDGVDVGFVSGVETTHPDKGTEMFLYELGVDEAHRHQGVARALVEALLMLAQARGCHGMWVATEPGNEAAIATYRSAGATPPEPSVTMEWTFKPD